MSEAARTEQIDGDSGIHAGTIVLPDIDDEAILAALCRESTN